MFTKFKYAFFAACLTVLCACGGGGSGGSGTANGVQSTTSGALQSEAAATFPLAGSGRPYK